MSRGKRYNGEQKLNYKKVLAVVIAVIVLIMCIFIIRSIVTKVKNPNKQSNELNYFSLYENNLWGIVDSKGNIVIEPMYQEMLIVVDKAKDVFLCTYDIDETNNTYKTKVVNSKNEQLFTQYNKVEPIENHDESGNIWYEDNVLRVEENGKYGLIDLDGKELLSPIYEEISVLKGVKNSLILKQDGVYGLANDRGNVLITPKYTQILKLGKNSSAGYITVDLNNKYGVCDSTGKIVLENNYEKLSNVYGQNYFVIEESGKQKLINNLGESKLSDEFDKITQIIDSGIVFVKDDKYGVVDFEGNALIKPIYTSLEEINKNVFKANLNDKYGLIDLEENVKLPYQYSDIVYEQIANIYVAENSDYTSSVINSNFEIKLTGILSELNKDKKYIKLKINDEYKYYNFNLEEKQMKDFLPNNTLFLSKNNGKYGFVDSKGNVVVDYIYDDATEQNSYGYVAVKKDGLWGAINSTGSVIIEPKYNLDNNLVIDFIGKWHLGQDLNMNYYCEK